MTETSAEIKRSTPVCTTKHPEVPELADKSVVFRYAYAKVSKVWKKKPEILFKFIDKWSHEEKGIVKDCMEMWTGDDENKVLGIRFVESTLSDDKVDIRIAKRTGLWRTLVGTDAKKLPSGATVSLDDVTDKDCRHHILHELGHALGLEHEHQTDEAISKLDKDKVVQFFRRPPNNWTEQTTINNILSAVKSLNDVATEYDTDSIMHYYLPPDLLKPGQSFKNNQSISPKDVVLVKKLYPLDGNQAASIGELYGPIYSLSKSETEALYVPRTDAGVVHASSQPINTTVKVGSVVNHFQAQNLNSIENATLTGTTNSLMTVNNATPWNSPWGNTWGKN